MSKNYKRVTLICSVCGREFYIHPNEKGKRKHCSRECFHISRKGFTPWNKGLKFAKPKLPPTKICHLCGESFQPLHGNRQYCDKCRLSALSGSDRLRQLKFRIKNQAKLNSRPPRDPKQKAEYDNKTRFSGHRNEVLIRDNYQCQFPGCPSNITLIIHHKNTNEADNHIENLVTLCRKHHMYLHGLLESLKPLIF